MHKLPGCVLYGYAFPVSGGNGVCKGRLNLDSLEKAKDEIKVMMKQLHFRKTSLQGDLI